MTKFNKKKLRSLFEPLLATMTPDKYLPSTEWVQVDYAEGYLALSNAELTYVVATMIDCNGVQPQHFFVNSHMIKTLIQVVKSNVDYNISITSEGIDITSDSSSFELKAIKDFYGKIITSDTVLSAKDFWEDNYNTIAFGGIHTYNYDKELNGMVKKVRSVSNLEDTLSPIFISDDGAIFEAEDTVAMILRKHTDSIFHSLTKKSVDALVKLSSLTSDPLKVECAVTRPDKGEYEPYHNNQDFFNCLVDGMIVSIAPSSCFAWNRSYSDAGAVVDVKEKLDMLKQSNIKTSSSTQPYLLENGNGGFIKVRGGYLFNLFTNFPFSVAKFNVGYKSISLGYREGISVAFFMHRFTEYHD